MKKVLNFLLVAILLVVYSCQDETILVNETTSTKDQLQTNSKNNVGKEELIILYPIGTTEAEKQQKRNEYGVAEYKQCACADENLELWFFPKNDTINIEEVTETAKADEEIEGADANENIAMTPNQFIDASAVGDIANAISKIVPENIGVTVAVLDTGIDFDFNGFPNTFLYNSKNDGCTVNGQTDTFGWNFVHDNNIPYDDYSSKHGTIITNIITSSLTQHNIPHQILPVKIANANGNIKYFDALCGFKYATKKENIKVINMSFGWYAKELSLLGRFIEEVSEDILVVTSAGNSGLNNDNNPHYPSSYPIENILAVASLADSNGNGMVTQGLGLAEFSNYGMTSVDVAAIGENIPVLYNGEIYYMSGTSFSAAYASFFSAFNYEEGMPIQALKNQVITNSIFSANLYKIKYSSHIPNE